MTPYDSDFGHSVRSVTQAGGQAQQSVRQEVGAAEHRIAVMDLEWGEDYVAAAKRGDRGASAWHPPGEGLSSNAVASGVAEGVQGSHLRSSGPAAPVSSGASREVSRARARNIMGESGGRQCL